MKKKTLEQNRILYPDMKRNSTILSQKYFEAYIVVVLLKKTNIILQ